MGWTCLYTPPHDELAHIESIVTCENEERAMRPILTIRKGSTWYLAVEVVRKVEDIEIRDYTPDSFGRYVFAAVILTQRSGSEWCYKAMEEAMGPCEATAPMKLLNLLSETVNEYAISWRQRCQNAAAMANRKVKHGDVIRFAEPLIFADGVERQVFKIIKERFAGKSRNTTVFECVDTGVLCKISQFGQRAWVKV